MSSRSQSKTKKGSRLPRNAHSVSRTESQDDASIAAQSVTQKGKPRTRKAVRLPVMNSSGRSPWPEERPKTRADCIGKSRPCPWFGCIYNMAVDVTEAGSVIFNYKPDDRPGKRRPVSINTKSRDWQFERAADKFLGHYFERSVDPSCLLDIIDEHGDITLEQAGHLMSLTRERIRQIEARAMRKFASTGVQMGVFESEEIITEFLFAILRPPKEEDDQEGGAEE